ncbi:MAG: hypothetical protein FJZ09_00875 [Candidatus Omnitrophica bacterium]|nr:hypothetical protein [Candidatus Omnitrophota bacterium]
MINPRKVKTYSVKSRFSKVLSGDFAKPPVAGATFRRFLDSLPRTLKAQDLRRVIAALVSARKSRKEVIFMAGAHVIKCGLNPVVIELMKKKVVTCVCLNGAGLIHDFELAFQAKTSEDVAENLKSGAFGMGRETAEFINNAVSTGVSGGLGLGNAVASAINKSNLRFKRLSLLNQACQLGVPVLAFTAVGADIIHQHPSFDAGLAAEGSIRDFYQLVERIAGINRGGVVLNFGSAVILPEVFLKALNLARNLGSQVKDFTTANFDMIYHYRPAQNVCLRPVMSGGESFYIIGHHEITLPLLAQAVTEKL